MKQTKEDWKNTNSEWLVDMYKDCIEGLCDVPDSYIEALYDQYLEEPEEDDE